MNEGSALCFHVDVNDFFLHLFLEYFCVVGKISLFYRCLSERNFSIQNTQVEMSVYCVKAPDHFSPSEAKILPVCRSWECIDLELLT